MKDQTRSSTRVRQTLGLLAAASSAVLIASPSASASHEFIKLRSGWITGVSGIPGQAEDDIFFDPGAVTFGGAIKPTPFVPSDFTDAQPTASGVAAKVVIPFPGWIPSLPADHKARWIDFDLSNQYLNYAEIGTVLYAMPFTVNTASISSASLTLNWAVDDRLGDPALGPNPIGVYINGKPTTISGGTFGSQSSATYAIPPADLVGGGATNWIYFYQRDLGYQTSGLIFSARFGIIPAPGPAGLLGLSGLVAARRHRGPALGR